VITAKILWHRFLDYVPVGYVFETKAAAVGAAVGVGGTAGALGHWAAPGYFLVALLAAMTMELLSCYLSKDKPQRREHNWERAFIGKLFIVFLGVCALLLDGAMFFGVRALPVEAKIIGNGVLPVTLSSMVWFLVAEVARTVRNVAHYEGTDTTVPPAILLFLRWVKKRDAERYPGDPAQLPRRWTDDLTEEQIRDVLEHHRNRTLEEDDDAEEPASPVA
jgi:hypothetical protein